MGKSFFPQLGIVFFSVIKDPYSRRKWLRLFSVIKDPYSLEKMVKSFLSSFVVSIVF